MILFVSTPNKENEEAKMHEKVEIQEAVDISIEQNYFWVSTGLHYFFLLSIATILPIILYLLLDKETFFPNFLHWWKGSKLSDDCYMSFAGAELDIICLGRLGILIQGIGGYLMFDFVLKLFVFNGLRKILEKQIHQVKVEENATLKEFWERLKLITKMDQIFINEKSQIVTGLILSIFFLPVVFITLAYFFPSAMPRGNSPTTSLLIMVLVTPIYMVVFSLTLEITYFVLKQASLLLKHICLVMIKQVFTHIKTIYLIFLLELIAVGIFLDMLAS
ncbi:MAG: hypothetical protein ACKVTZ_20370 [Bacteroidia bacterium]